MGDGEGSGGLSCAGWPVEEHVRALYPHTKKTLNQIKNGFFLPSRGIKKIKGRGKSSHASSL